MNETEFNLLDEPWIRVMDAECRVHEVSLTDALLRAHEYTALSGELPTQDAAVLRLLLAVLHTVFSRADANGTPCRMKTEDDALERWQELWELGALPEQPVRDYLAQWRERFWLFHPERPFGQVAELTYGTQYEASKMNGEISESSNKTRLFSSYYGSEKNELYYEQAARWLLYLNAYDDTSSKPTKEGKEKAGGSLPSPGAGWLGKLGLVFLTGENLFETLMLNLVLIHNEHVEHTARPVWEREHMPSGERVEIPMPDNLAELYTLQSRRILLKRNGDKVCGYILLGGDFFAKENAFEEPMTIWNLPKASKGQKADYVPKRHDASKQMWREFAVLYSHSENRRAGVIAWYQEYLSSLLPKTRLMTTTAAAVQYGDKDFFVKHIYSDSLSLHAGLLAEAGRNWRNDIQTEINRCEQLANAAAYLAQNLYVASGGSENNWGDAGKNAREQMYYRLDVPFREWLSSIDPDKDGQEKCDAWQEQAKKIAFQFADEQALHASDAAITGHLLSREDQKKRSELYSVPKAMRIFYGTVSKIYRKV